MSDLKSFVEFAKTLRRLEIGNDVFLQKVYDIYYDCAMRYSDELRDLECERE